MFRLIGVLPLDHHVLLTLPKQNCGTQKTVHLCFRAHQVFYMFGFLSLVFLILIITCSEATILLAYFHLCAEDYHWWWRSFFTSGFTAVYLFAYCVHYLSKLSIQGTISTLLYFSYTGIFVFLFFLMTGEFVFGVFRKFRWRS